jgi:hypothetical protein
LHELPENVKSSKVGEIRLEGGDFAGFDSETGYLMV